MKKYLVIILVSFVLGCIFYFAHTWSIMSGSEVYAFRILAVIMVCCLILSLIAVALKLLLRKNMDTNNDLN